MEKNSSESSIFISIASFLDPELLPTLESLSSNANRPNMLNVCIGFQYNEEIKKQLPQILKYKNAFGKLELICIEADKSKGCCWVRSEIQKKYSGEKYFLQLDSHHRFIEGWDDKCINMYKDLYDQGYNPVLTAYVPSYDPDNDPEGRVQEAWQLNFDRFIPEGTFFTIPSKMENTSRPRRSAFLSAHFLFTEGGFINKVPYDPNLFFHSEEGSLAIRAFTHGYDLFNPNEIICWHEYTRKGRVKVWDVKKDWEKANDESHKRNRELFGVDCDVKDFGRYGLGDKRTLREYCEFSGIFPKTREIYKFIKLNPEPPVINSQKVLNFKHCINVHKSSFKKENYKFWSIFLKDSEGRELLRTDIYTNIIKGILEKDGDFADIWVEAELTEFPSSWIVWTNDGEWTDEYFNGGL